MGRRWGRQLPPEIELSVTVIKVKITSGSGKKTALSREYDGE